MASTRKSTARLVAAALLVCFSFTIFYKGSVFHAQWNNQPTPGPAPSQSHVRSTLYNSTAAAVHKPIPVVGLGAPCDHGALLLRLVYSLDYYIEDFVVVLGDVHDTLETELHQLERSSLAYIRDLHFVKSRSAWVGVADTWNTIMTFQPKAEFVLILSIDIQLLPGSLARLNSRIRADIKADRVDQVFINWTNPGMSGGYSTFAMTRSLIDKAGLFDENIYPAYYEDSEYDLRMTKLEKRGIAIRRAMYEDVRALHGHVLNGTYFSEGVIASFINKKSCVARKTLTTVIVRDYIQPYLTEKWGCTQFATPDWFSNCTYEYPFNNPKNALTYWNLDVNRRRTIEAALVKG